VMGGFLGQYFGLRVPFFAASGLALANALFGLTVLKESLPLARRRRFEWWRANPLGTLAALRRYPALIVLFAVLVMVRLAHDALPSTWTYYTMLKFHWGPAAVSLSLAMVGVLTALSFGVLPRVLVPRLGETKAVFLGLACAAMAYAGYAFAPTPAVLYGWMTLLALGGVANPALNAILSHLVPADEQGELQGAIASIGGLTSIVSPLVMTSLFAWFTSGHAPLYFPGASFFAASLAELGALALFVGAHARKASPAVT
jgi:MFS transporter, DHA1 family, tetracycline resistance protein